MHRATSPWCKTVLASDIVEHDPAALETCERIPRAFSGPSHGHKGRSDIELFCKVGRDQTRADAVLCRLFQAPAYQQTTVAATLTARVHGEQVQVPRFISRTLPVVLGVWRGAFQNVLVGWICSAVVW